MFDHEGRHGAEAPVVPGTPEGADQDPHSREAPARTVIEPGREGELSREQWSHAHRCPVATASEREIQRPRLGQLRAWVVGLSHRASVPPALPASTLASVNPDGVTLRPDLLEGRSILFAGAGPLPDGLGATLEHLEDPAALDDDSVASFVSGLVDRVGRLDALVVDCASIHAAGGPSGMADALDSAWRLARAAATEAMIEGGGGTMVLIAPESSTGDPGAAAVADGLENAARGLSVEWARFDIRLVAICPRPGVAPSDIRDLVAWLCSGSGTYASGCRLEPGRPA